MNYIERIPLTGLNIVRMHSVRWTQYFQQGLGMRSSSTEYMRWMSFMMDSNVYFWLLYPLCNFIQPVLGMRVLFALLTTDWIVHILKCIFPDDRPYWWFPLTEYSKGGVSETTMFEFPETCQEVTSGFPSIHSAQFAAISFVILSHLHRGLKSKNILKSWTFAVRVFTVGIFVLLNLTGIVARMLLATSFHYQLFSGILIGTIIGRLACSNRLYRYYMKNGRSVFYYSCTIYLTLCCICIFLYFKNEDPFWTIPLALKWCWNISYVFKSLKRNLLFYVLRIFGTSVAFLISNYAFGLRLPVVVGNWKRTALLGALDAIELGTTYFIWRQIELWTIGQFLCTSFLLHVGHIVLITDIFPIIVKRLTSTFGNQKRSNDKYSALRAKLSRYAIPSHS